MHWVIITTISTDKLCAVGTWRGTVSSSPAGHSLNSAQGGNGLRVTPRVARGAVTAFFPRAITQRQSRAACPKSQSCRVHLPPGVQALLCWSSSTIPRLTDAAWLRGWFLTGCIQLEHHVLAHSPNVELSLPSELPRVLPKHPLFVLDCFAMIFLFHLGQEGFVVFLFCLKAKTNCWLLIFVTCLPELTLHSFWSWVKQLCTPW